MPSGKWGAVLTEAAAEAPSDTVDGPDDEELCRCAGASCSARVPRRKGKIRSSIAAQIVIFTKSRAGATLPTFIEGVHTPEGWTCEGWPQVAHWGDERD